jgi:hypothetical protein
VNLKQEIKKEFHERLQELVQSLGSYVSTKDGQWTIKGFIDTSGSDIFCGHATDEPT